MPVRNKNAVVFSATTQVFVKPYGAPDSQYRPVGLLGQNAQLQVEEAVREKKDFFPEVPVAVAVQSRSARLEATLREWESDNVAIAFGLTDSDFTATTDQTTLTESVKVGLSGKVNYFTVRLEELLTNGWTREVVLHKARIGLRGGLSFASVEEGGDIPIVINAVYDPAADALLTINTKKPVQQQS